VQRFTRSTCSDGVPNSGEHDCAIPVARVLGSSSGKLHGLLGDLSKGLDRAEEGGKGVDHGGCPRVALAGRGEVVGAAGELVRVRRGTEEATGMMAGYWGGLYRRGRGHGAAAGARGFACGRALSVPPSVSPRRTRGGLLLPGFNGRFDRLSVQILAKPHVQSLPCTKPYLFDVSSKQGYSRSREIWG
jgi:hypothetical protein